MSTLAVAVVAAVSVIAVVVPTGLTSTSAAAAELREIAIKAGEQPTLKLASDQWLATEYQESAAVEILLGPGRVNQTTQAQATIRSTVQEWSNSSGASCVSLSDSSAQFASATNRAAWQASGFLVAPQTDALTGCVGFSGANESNDIGDGVGVVNVADLPTDPKTLAQELSTGTTGIQGLDQLSAGPKTNGGFERAVALLIGPTIGASPAFNSALYQALALIPGIQSLGIVTTHLGSTGLGFSARSFFEPSAIIVDPTTGQLLEARNIQQWVDGTALVNAYEASFAGNFASKVVLQWIDPSGAPSSLDATALPPAIRLALHQGNFPGFS